MSEHGKRDKGNREKRKKPLHDIKEKRRLRHEKEHSAAAQSAVVQAAIKTNS